MPRKPRMLLQELAALFGMVMLMSGPILESLALSSMSMGQLFGQRFNPAAKTCLQFFLCSSWPRSNSTEHSSQLKMPMLFLIHSSSALKNLWFLENVFLWFVHEAKDRTYYNMLSHSRTCWGAWRLGSWSCRRSNHWLISWRSSMRWTAGHLLRSISTGNVGASKLLAALSKGRDADLRSPEKHGWNNVIVCLFFHVFLMQMKVNTFKNKVHTIIIKHNFGGLHSCALRTGDSTNSSWHTFPICRSIGFNWQLICQLNWFLSSSQWWLKQAAKNVFIHVSSTSSTALAGSNRRTHGAKFGQRRGRRGLVDLYTQIYSNQKACFHCLLLCTNLFD